MYILNLGFYLNMPCCVFCCFNFFVSVFFFVFSFINISQIFSLFWGVLHICLGVFFFVFVLFRVDGNTTIISTIFYNYLTKFLLMHYILIFWIILFLSVLFAVFRFLAFGFGHVFTFIGLHYSKLFLNFYFKRVKSVWMISFHALC